MAFAGVGGISRTEHTDAKATLPIEESYVKVREYLRTSYSPVCDSDDSDTRSQE